LDERSGVNGIASQPLNADLAVVSFVTTWLAPSMAWKVVMTLERVRLLVDGVDRGETASGSLRGADDALVRVEKQLRAEPSA
jgi:hypothetical protein